MTITISGSDDNSIWIWNASTGAALHQLYGHTELVKSVAFSHDGTHIVSGSCDYSVRVWDALTGATLQQQLNGHIISCSDVTFIWKWNEMHHSVLWNSTVDGWIISLTGQDRLVWIPQGIQEIIYHPYNSLIISQKGYAHIDFQGCNVGTKWAECYKPLLVVQ